jgi:hypothetical protein
MSEKPHVNQAEQSFDPDDSPFMVYPVAGIPFGKRSEEAQAIERVLAKAERERASSDA